MAVHVQQSTYHVNQKFERLSFQYESQLSVDSTMSSASSTPSTPTTPIDFEIRIATENDKDSIIEFLRTFFFRDEPLNAYLELINDERPTCLDLERYATKNIGQGLSLLAIYDKKLIGVCLNSIVKREDVGKSDDFVVTDEKFIKIYNLLGYVAKESNPFEKFPESDKAMIVEIISVDNSMRGKGIAKELLQKTREIAKEKNCNFMSVDCTSAYSAKAMKRLGFELIYAMDYSDYKVNGETVFQPADPHRAVTSFVQNIS